MISRSFSSRHRLQHSRTQLVTQTLQPTDEAEGLLALLDSLQDYAVDDLGLPAKRRGCQNLICIGLNGLAGSLEAAVADFS